MFFRFFLYVFVFSEREENWRRCLQALFVFPESRDVVKSSESSWNSIDAFLKFYNQCECLCKIFSLLFKIHVFLYFFN